MAAATGTSFNPFLPEFRADPHPFYHLIRRDDPVHYSATLGVWVLTRYADVMLALRDPRFSASARRWTHYEKFFFRGKPGGATGAAGGAGVGRPLAEAYGRWMLQLDPPDHTRLRALVNKAFTPRVAESLRPRVQRAVNELLAKVAARGEMDVIADLAYPLPIIVIAELLGVPPEDHEKIKHWSAALLPSFSPALAAETVARVGEAIDAFNDYFRTLARRRRAEPRDDLMSALIAAREHGDRLSEDELLATCILLAFAGHASTVQLIGNAAVELLRRPDELARLRGDWSLIGDAIEETLRHASPLQLVYRTTVDDVPVGAKTIPARQMVFVSLAAANRDPGQFPDPDRFDVTRRDNRHVAFGHSIHYCAGAPLARLEGQVAIRTLFERFAGLALSGQPTREPSLLLRGLTSVPVRFAAS